MKVKAVLSQKPVSGIETISAQETMGELVTRLKERRIGALVVTSGDNALAGVISERDVVRALATDGEVCLRSPVSRYMTSEVMTTTPEEDTVNVLERMTAGRFRHMPVLDKGELVGVISIGDVVKVRIEALQRENAAMEEFIRS